MVTVSSHCNSTLNPNISKFCDFTGSKFSRFDQPGAELEFYAIFVIGNCLILLGFFTSVLTFLIFMRDRSTARSTRQQLRTIAIVDFLFLLSCFFYLEIKTYYRFFRSTDLACSLCEMYNDQYYLTLVTTVTNFLEMFRNWLIVLVGAERYIVACHSLRAPTLCTPKNVLRSTLCIAIIVAILRVPMFVRRIVGHYAAYVVHHWIDCIFLYSVPVLLLAIFSIRIKAVLRQSSNFNQQFSRSATSHQHFDRIAAKVTRTLLVVLVLAIFLGLPYLFYTGITLIVDGQIKFTESTLQVMRTVIRTVVVICWVFSLAMSTSNFFVYVAFHKPYRELLRGILTCRPEPDHKRHNTAAACSLIQTDAVNFDRRNEIQCNNCTIEIDTGNANTLLNSADVAESNHNGATPLMKDTCLL